MPVTSSSAALALLPGGAGLARPTADARALMFDTQRKERVKTGRAGHRAAARCPGTAAGLAAAPSRRPLGAGLSARAWRGLAGAVAGQQHLPAARSCIAEPRPGSAAPAGAGRGGRRSSVDAARGDQRVGLHPRAGLGKTARRAVGEFPARCRRAVGSRRPTMPGKRIVAPLPQALAAVLTARGVALPAPPREGEAGRCAPTPGWRRPGSARRRWNRRERRLKAELAGVAEAAVEAKSAIAGKALRPRKLAPARRTTKKRSIMTSDSCRCSHGWPAQQETRRKLERRVSSASSRRQRARRPALPFIESEVGIDVLGRVCCALGRRKASISPTSASRGIVKGTQCGLAGQSGRGRRKARLPVHAPWRVHRPRTCQGQHRLYALLYGPILQCAVYGADGQPVKGLRGRGRDPSRNRAENRKTEPPGWPRQWAQSSPMNGRSGTKSSLISRHRSIARRAIFQLRSRGPVVERRWGTGGIRAILTPDKPFDCRRAGPSQDISRNWGRYTGRRRRKRPSPSSKAMVVREPPPPAKRRNFDAFSPVTPWLVTDIEIAGKEAEGDELRATLARPKPARIHFPGEHGGQPLDSLAHFEMTNLPPGLPHSRAVAADHPKQRPPDRGRRHPGGGAETCRRRRRTRGRGSE